MLFKSLRLQVNHKLFLPISASAHECDPFALRVSDPIGELGARLGVLAYSMSEGARVLNLYFRTRVCIDEVEQCLVVVWFRNEDDERFTGNFEVVWVASTDIFVVAA